MNKNSENPGVGAAFQKAVARWLEQQFDKEFILEKKIAMGHPAKNHKFDIVSSDDTMAIECKCYTWTETGNVPSAKMGFTNEAAFYLSFIPDTYEKFIVMKLSRHPKREETLAEYYFRMNRHLIGKTKVADFDAETGEFRVVGSNN